MRFGEVLSFKKDIFFDGAVQIDWFYDQEKAKKVAENFVFHGSEYFGASDNTGKKLTDTIQFVYEISNKISEEQHINPLTLAIAGYGTGKSHLAVTLAELLSGDGYHTKVYNTILKNIGAIDGAKAKEIKKATAQPNLVLVLNGMKDFNLNYELLKSAQKSLRIYGYSDEKLKKINRAIETAFRFFERNSTSSLSLFESKAREYGYSESGEKLVERLRSELGEEESAFNVINSVYNEINGNEIRWDEGISATAVLETLLHEYCGISGPFEKIVIIFDEFGRYLEYASSTTTAKSGDSALQQIFECAQNADGDIHVINLIQSDIKSYLQRVDQTSNISRYIGRYDASDKFYLSSNLETVFANLIYRRDKTAFQSTICSWQKEHESEWKTIFDDMNRWLPTKGLWKDYKLFRQVVIEGIYPLHPLSTYMLSQLSDYLQNRSSLMLLGRYVNGFENVEIDISSLPYVYPETLLSGDLFTEMLSAEEEGRQYSQHCIRYNNILRKYSDKLSENSSKILRANLALRILRCRTNSYDDVKHAIGIFSGLSQAVIEEELVWLENEYAILGYDDHSCCFDFLEDSSGAHDFKTFFKRIRANTSFSCGILEESKIRELADVISPQSTNFSTAHKIRTNEWQYEQDLFSINDLSENYAQTWISDWKSAISPDKLKGKLIWLYLNRDSATNALENAQLCSSLVENTPIILMLLNDAEDKLNSAVCDYLALQKFSETDQKKYGRHFDDKMQQTEENIRNAFDSLKKQRLRITPQGVVPLNGRLAVSLSEVFENVYPCSVPFDFDGFDSKQPGKARKAFCSIAKLVLSGAINEETIRNSLSEIRNRFEATLYYSKAFSWKIVNSEYQIIPPENKSVRKIYDEISNMLPEGGELSLDFLINKLVSPPYGMNDYVAVYMIVVFCANLSYCLRVVLDDSVYSINAWKEEVIQENKIDLNRIRKSTLKHVNAGEVADKFLRIFSLISSNMDIAKVNNYNKELEVMKKSENIPDSLHAQYQLAMNKIQEGIKIKRNWDSIFEEVMSKRDQLVEQRDIYPGLKAIEILSGGSFYNCFRDTTYAMTEDQREEILQCKNDLKRIIDPYIGGWISEQRCKGVENISQYRKHMERIYELLFSLGYVDEAAAAKTRAEKELSNVEDIRARQQLRSNYSDFLQNNIVKPAVPYIRLLEWKKQGDLLLEHIDKFKSTLGQDAEKYSNNVSNRIAEINRAIEAIKQDMNDIYEDIYSIVSVDDIQDMISRIQLVCQKGIPSNDMADFTELRKSLESVIESITELTDCKNNRDDFLSKREEILNKYSQMEMDFDVVSIIEQVAESIAESLDVRDNEWKKRFLDNQTDNRSSMLAWVDNTRVIPKYLSQNTYEMYLVRKKYVDEQLSKAKIDDVLYSFNKLGEKEREECFDKIVELLKNNQDKHDNEDNNKQPIEELSFTKNKKWDLEEWIVLVKLYFENKDKTRTELQEELSLLSIMLNKRADALGIEHDDKYRNINGLAMQFDRIKYIDTNGAKGLSAYSELANAAIEMYHNNRDGFNLLAENCFKKYC